MDKETLHRLYWEEELTQREIAKRYSVSAMCICNRMKRYGIPARRKGSRAGTGRGNYRVPLPSRDSLQALRDSGVSISRIAQQYGLSYQGMRRRLLQMGMMTAQKHKVSPENITEVKRLYWEEGISAYAIASLYDVSAETIHRWLTQDGSQLRTRSEAAQLRWDRVLSKEQPEVDWPEVEELTSPSASP